MMRSIWIWSAEFLSTLSLRRATFFANVKNVWDHVFLSTLSLRRATTMRPWMQAAMTYFYPRSPCGERHGAELDIHHNFPISIHALLAESDSAGQAEKPGNRDFYPRSPCGERPSARSLVASLSRQFLSTLSLRRATAGQFCPGRTFQISIHALLAESDLTFTFTLILLSVISIHALLAESDFKANVHRAKSRLFLSTLSLRRATILCVLPVVQHTDFYPRSPCGERLNELLEQSASYHISIHALLAESDNRYGRPIDVQFVFLSTLSLRRATHYDNYNLHCTEISIHALLAESDDTVSTPDIPKEQFLSTLSLRRATTNVPA